MKVILSNYQLSSYTKIFRCITYFTDLIKEHLIAHIDVIQNAKRGNTLKSYRMYFSKWKRWTERFEEVKPLPAANTYVSVYLLDLVKQGETF